MKINLTKYRTAIFFVLCIIATGVTQAGTAQTINTTVSHLEAGLQALQANELETAQKHMKAARQSSKNITGGSYEVKAQRGYKVISAARRHTKEGNTDSAITSLKQAIDMYKALLNPDKSGGRGGLK